MNTNSLIPSPDTTAYWAWKQQAAVRAEELRREAIARAFQRLLSSLQEPLNWRKVRGSMG
jgi:hypothetical protein